MNSSLLMELCIILSEFTVNKKLMINKNQSSVGATC